MFPELFRRQLTDKENEAVANPARFAGEPGARALAGRDYQQRMAAIFAECRRVLKGDGIMTLMFTHKATGAWDALTTGLIEAGFVITASWPVNTEAEGSLHIKDKAAANSTIFLVCRPRQTGPLRPSRGGNARTVHEASSAAYGDERSGGLLGRGRAGRRDGPCARGLRSSRARGSPGSICIWRLSARRLRSSLVTGRCGVARRAKSRLSDAGSASGCCSRSPWDPYAVTPEDALDAARREVKRWRLAQLTHVKADDDLDRD